MADFSKYYRAYKTMQELLKSDFTYNYLMEGFRDGDKGEDSHDGRTNEKVIDMDWVIAIEETLPYIQKAIDEQRRFIKQVENVVRIELARKVGPDSVRHLSQHTNFIAKVDDDGMVTPNKILTTEREESFAIYENRVLMTLIRKALFFVDDKYAKMKDVPNDSFNKMSVKRRLNLNQQTVDFNFGYVNKSQEQLADDLDVMDVSELSDFDRIRRIRSTLNEFLATPLMKAIAKEPEVRPPLTQTNLLKKNPNFKKAVELWNFLDSYKRSGFDVVSEDYEGKMSKEVQEDVYFAMGFEHFMLSITTNPALRRMLHQKYEDENARIAEEEAKPEKVREAVLNAKLNEIRKEEMEIRLKEIREREKKILDLTNEIKTLKNTLEQREQQILTLKGKVSMLQDQIEELKKELQETKLKLLAAEQKIKELEEENAELKAEIVRLNAQIDELNAHIDELNAQIDTLNAKIAELENEIARLNAKIKEQQELIEWQKNRIAELEKINAEQQKKIEYLTDKVESLSRELEESKRQVAALTAQNKELTDTLEAERVEHKNTIDKMNADFEAKTAEEEARHQSEIAAMQQRFDDAEQAHAAKVAQMNADFEAKTAAEEARHQGEVKSIQKKLDDSEASHTSIVAKMNADFAEKTSKAEQAHIKELQSKQEAFEKQITNIKTSNTAANEALLAKHATEVAKVQKSVDKRVEEVQKQADKRVKEKEAQYKKSASEEIKRAERQASEKSNAYREQVKAYKPVAKDVILDYSFGCTQLMASIAGALLEDSTENLSARLAHSAKNICSIGIEKSKKGIVLTQYSQDGAKVIQQYKKAVEPNVANAEITQLLSNISKLPVCVTYSGYDKNRAEAIANSVRQATGKNPSIVHNTTLKSKGIIAIYYCK